MEDDNLNDARILAAMEDDHLNNAIMDDVSAVSDVLDFDLDGDCIDNSWLAAEPMAPACASSPVENCNH
jgi:hypothetical protein